MSDFFVWNYPMQAAQIAVADEIPAAAAYEVLSALGATVSREQFDRLYGQALHARNLVPETGSLELDLVPPSSLIQHRSTVTSSGFQFQLLVSATDTETGEPIEIPYSIVTPDLITPGEAIEAAVVSQTLRAKDYAFEVLGATLTGVYELNPEMAAA